MEISQELEDKLVGIAVVKGYWYAAAYWLQETELFPISELDKAYSIVYDISEKHEDLHIVMFDSNHRFWQRHEYLDECS